MAHLHCKCGCSIWNGQTPNDIEFTVFSDARVCELLDNPPTFLTKSPEPGDSLYALMDLMDMADYEVWRCSECGRLYVFDKQNNPNQAKYVYRLEKD